MAANCWHRSLASPINRLSPLNAQLIKDRQRCFCQDETKPILPITSPRIFELTLLSQQHRHTPQSGVYQPVQLNPGATWQKSGSDTSRFGGWVEQRILKNLLTQSRMERRRYKIFFASGIAHIPLGRLAKTYTLSHRSALKVFADICYPKLA